MGDRAPKHPHTRRLYRVQCTPHCRYNAIGERTLRSCLIKIAIHSNELSWVFFLSSSHTGGFLPGYFAPDLSQLTSVDICTQFSVVKLGLPYRSGNMHKFLYVHVCLFGLLSCWLLLLFLLKSYSWYNTHTHIQ